MPWALFTYGRFRIVGRTTTILPAIPNNGKTYNAHLGAIHSGTSNAAKCCSYCWAAKHKGKICRKESNVWYDSPREWAVGEQAYGVFQTSGHTVKMEKLATHSSKVIIFIVAGRVQIIQGLTHFLAQGHNLVPELLWRDNLNKWTALCTTHISTWESHKRTKSWAGTQVPNVCTVNKALKRRSPVVWHWKKRSMWHAPPYLEVLGMSL